MKIFPTVQRALLAIRDLVSRLSAAHLRSGVQDSGSPHLADIGRDRLMDVHEWSERLSRTVSRARYVLTAGRPTRPFATRAILRELLDLLNCSIRVPAETTSGETSTHEVVDATTDVAFTFTPWVGASAVGLRCGRVESAPEYLYFAVDRRGHVGVYRGRAGDPGLDECLHWYLLDMPTELRPQLESAPQPIQLPPAAA